VTPSQPPCSMTLPPFPRLSRPAPHPPPRAAAQSCFSSQVRAHVFLSPHPSHFSVYVASIHLLKPAAGRSRSRREPLARAAACCDNARPQRRPRRDPLENEARHQSISHARATSHASIHRRACLASAAVVVITWCVLRCLSFAQVRPAVACACRADLVTSNMSAFMFPAHCDAAAAIFGYLASGPLFSERRARPALSRFRII
jgi:hypothetical protein